MASSSLEGNQGYLSVGPVWETPTKPGRPATGLAYVRWAAQNFQVPWFAIGGIDEHTLPRALEAGLSHVPVVVRRLSDEEAQLVALAENLQREDLNPLEETEGILGLLALRLVQPVEEVMALPYRMDNEVKGKATHNVMGKPEAVLVGETFHALARGSWQSFVANRLPLLKLPGEVLEAIRSGRLDCTKALARQGLGELLSELERLLEG